MTCICVCIWWTLPLVWRSLYLTYSGRVQYHNFLRVLRVKACPLSAKVSHQIAWDFLNQDLMLRSAYFVTFSNSICVTWFMIYYYQNATRFLLGILKQNFLHSVFLPFLQHFFQLSKIYSNFLFAICLLSVSKTWTRAWLERSLCGLFRLLLIYYVLYCITDIFIHWCGEVWDNYFQTGN